MATNLKEYAFESITVDRRGNIIARTPGVARAYPEDLGGGVMLEMVGLEGGSFLMGSRGGQGYPDEHPQHTVRLPPFLLGKYPVTQEQWLAVMGRLPRCRFSGPRRPVENVSWLDAQRFCRRLSGRTGWPYALPSEAQWEYACRAGSTTPFATGPTITTDFANYVGEWTFADEPKGVYRHGTTDTCSFPPNEFGLYDMHGNVWEWCADAWHDDYDGAPSDGSAWGARRGEDAYRVARGGSWHEVPGHLRSAARLRGLAAEGDEVMGLRVALLTGT